jgi:peptide/nickel transport system substrate-binding protein
MLFQKKFWRGLIICLAFAPAILVVAACGKEEISVADDSGKQIARPMVGGTLHIGSTQEPDTFDPIRSKALATSRLANLVFDGLLKLDENMQFIPCLAQEVPTVANGGVSSDGLAVTYNLNPAAKWQDGTNLTAEDVVFTFSYIKKSDSTVYSDFYRSISKVESAGDYTVIVHYRESRPDYLLAFPWVLPKHLLNRAGSRTLDAFFQAPVGSGPFVVEKWRKGDLIEFRRNDTYFRGKPKLELIHYHVLESDEALLMQIKTRGVDIATDLLPDGLGRLERESPLEVIIIPGLAWENITFNTNRAPLDQLLVRQAFAAAVDQQAILDIAFNGAGEATAGFLPKTSWAHNHSLLVSPGDPEKALALLARAGYADSNGDRILEKDGRSLEIELLIPKDDQARIREADELAAQLARAGIRLKFRQVALADMASRLAGGSFEAALVGWQLSPDPDQRVFWHSAALPPTGKNYARYSNSRMDTLLDVGSASLDFSRRRDAYISAQLQFVQDVPAVSICFTGHVVCVSDTVANFKGNPTLQSDFWNAHEWQLLKK